MSLSRHFTLAELTHSNTAVARGIANQPDGTQLARLTALCENVLDPLRDALDRPLRVTSGFRSAALNAAIPGSSATSQHSLGEAADLQCPGLNTATLFKTVIRLGLPFDQLIYEAKSASSIWVHVSHRAGANRGQMLIAHFPPGGKVRYSAVTTEEALAIPEATRSLMAEPELSYEELADEPARRAPRAPRARTAAAKAAGKKASAKPTAAGSTAAKAAPAKKTPAKKATAKKAPAKRAPAKEASAKKAPAKKTPVKKAPAKRAPAKKAPARKASSTKASAKPVQARPAPTSKKAPKPAATKPKAAAGRAKPR